MVYLSPEGYLHIAGLESNLSCKLDVFALGLLFCQYLTGQLPQFDHSEYQYAYESVLDDNALGLSAIYHDACRTVIAKMLDKHPENRPDMRAVFRSLNDVLLDLTGRTKPVKVSEPPPNFRSGVEGRHFYFEIAGDL